jgi:NADP-dependent 3-hydroxy acid dehydrogenase YdfG
VEQAVKDISKKTENETLALVCDATDSTSVQDTVNKSISHFGYIDILINNAGTTVRETALNLSEEDWDKVIFASNF